MSTIDISNDSYGFGSIVSGHATRPEPVRPTAADDRMAHDEVRGLFKTEAAYQQALALDFPTSSYQRYSLLGRRELFWSRQAVTAWIERLRACAASIKK